MNRPIERHRANGVDEVSHVERLEHDRLHHRAIEARQVRGVSGSDDHDVHRRQVLGFDEGENVRACAVRQVEIEHENAIRTARKEAFRFNDRTRDIGGQIRASKHVQQQFAAQMIVFHDEHVDGGQDGHWTVTIIRASDPRRVELDRAQSRECRRKTLIRCGGAILFHRLLSTMTAEIRTKKIGSKWHGFIEGRPDIDETALSESAAREKVESVRARLGECGAATRLFGGLTCELVKGHVARVGERLQHARDGKVWIDVAPEDGAGVIESADLRNARRSDGRMVRRGKG